MIAVSIVILLSRLDVLEAFYLPNYRHCAKHLVRTTKIPVHKAFSFSGRGGKPSSSNQGSNQSKRSKKIKSKESTTGTNRKRNTRSGGMGSSSRDAYDVNETNNNLNGIDLPNTKRSTPPWQVLHPTDRARNAAALKARREILAQGLPDPGLPYTSPSSSCNDKNNNNNKLKRQIRFASEADRKFLLWKRFSWKDPLSGMALIGSFLDKTLPPRLGVPEVAFLGRSNVGKSSLLNKLVSTLSSSFHTTSSSNSVDTKMDWARVSKTPGATASLNMYALLGKKMATTTSPILLGFADLPGFGYAKLSKDIKENIEITAEQYLDKRKELALVILLVDARRVPSEEDRTVLEALYQSGKPICVVATKADKIVSSPSTSTISSSGSHRMLSDNLQAIQDVLGLPEGQPLTVSSVTGLGIKDLWEIILEACEAHVAECKAKLENGNNYNKEDDDDTWKDGEQNIIDEDYNMVYSQGMYIIHTCIYIYIYICVVFCFHFFTNYLSYMLSNIETLGYEWNSNEVHDRIDFDDTMESEWNTDTVDDSMNSNVAKVQQGSNLKSLKKLAREKLRRGDV
jgi:GTP-binding protein